MDRFLHTQASAGVLLLLAAMIALIWANSPWGDSYDHLWHTPVSFGIGSWRIEESLHFWINELLMTVFFLVVGLEIKRELVEGALSNMKRASLPVAAALGGMVVPALIYVALNPSGPAHEGWGVPMATDIAFAVGVLTLLGKRVPATLRVLLLAVAIIDDIGAILVIAVFYSSGLSVAGLLIAAAGISLLFLMLKMGVRPSFVYAVPILIMWAGMLKTGIHPTIAGVLAGLAAPVKPWFGKEGFIATAREVIDEFQDRITREHHDHDLFEPLSRLATARKEALSPSLRAELVLHPWVAYVIMPLFALANAGVHIQGVDLSLPGQTMIMAGVVLGLVLGKPLGVILFSRIAVWLKLCSLPDGVAWSGVLVLGVVAGIGFTMAIFIAELAFADPAMLGSAKLGVLIATAVAAVVGLLLGYILLPREQPIEVAQLTASDAEASTEYWTDENPVVGQATG
jgi:NhaA family Na+:H+ antiporter